MISLKSCEHTLNKRELAYLINEGWTVNIFDMAKLAAELELPSRFFVTRDRGELAFEPLAAALQAVPEEGSLILQFPPSQVMDVSFVDETIIRLGQEIVAGKHGNRRLLLQGLTQDSKDNIDAAIRLQRLKIAFLAISSDKTWEIVGHLEDSLREVLDMLAQRPSLTAPELAEEKELALNSANNRLKRLFDLHLIRRKYEVSEKGLIYYYHFWYWEEEA